MKGVVKKLSEKGFGFIKGEDGQDRFFHASDLTAEMNFKTLQMGQSVTFESVQGPKGLRAVNVEGSR